MVTRLYEDHGIGAVLHNPVELDLSLFSATGAPRESPVEEACDLKTV